MDPTQNRCWVSRLRHEARPSLPFSCAVSALVARFCFCREPRTLSIEARLFISRVAKRDGNV